MSNRNSTFRAIDVRESATRQKLADARRDVFMRENSKSAPKLVASVLDVYKKNGEYFLNNNQVIQTSPQKNLTKKDVDKFRYDRYLEALNALIHNINFITNVHYFGKESHKDGIIIDMDYIIENTKFEYNATLRSLSESTRSIPNQIKDVSNLNARFEDILNLSIEIVDNLKKTIDIPALIVADPSFKEKFAKDNDKEMKSIRNANILILWLQSNKFRLQKFSDCISFEDKKESKFNK